jgi:hypothetical protein
MSTMTLRYLEERLSREAPALDWSCQPVAAEMLTGTMLPQEIQISAKKEGVPVKGSPIYISGECLVRWGVDTSAALICNEVTPNIIASQHRQGMEWDRLAEF